MHSNHFLRFRRGEPAPGHRDDAHHHGLTVQTCVEAHRTLPEQAA